MLLLSNKKARHEYAVDKTFTAGIVLSGPEVKSLKNKSGSLTGSFIKVVSGELFLINAQVTPYKFADNADYDPKRTRKLLVKKHELETITELLQQKGKAVIPLAIELAGNHIKVQCAFATGLKLYDKRAKLKKRTLDREVEKAIKAAR